MIQRQKLQIRLFYALLEHILVALEGYKKTIYTSVGCVLGPELDIPWHKCHHRAIVTG